MVRFRYENVFERFDANSNGFVATSDTVYTTVCTVPNRKFVKFFKSASSLGMDP